MPAKEIPSPAGWRFVVGWTALGTLVCVVGSLLFHALAFRNFEHDVFIQAVLSATILPLILGAPLFFLISLRLRDLKLANRRLTILATTDGLTGCLNRAAFTRIVDQYLIDTPLADRRGALLIVDADHFKGINDRFGHDQGDTALSLIARTMRGMLRASDAIGRLGGEEFGIFLPGVDATTAEIVAERLRRSINLAVFAPRGELRQLSISVGGSVFEGEIGFDELFHRADQRLYEAKQFGRNRVEIASAYSNDYTRRRAETAAAHRLAAE